MYPLELWLLKQFCDRYGLDYQEIDQTLTYWENKEHLQKLHIPRKEYGPLAADQGGLSGWRYKENAWESQREWYLETHFLTYYVSCIAVGWTISEEVGAPIPHYPRFSLETFVQQTS